VEYAASTGEGEVLHPVRRGVLRDIDEMEKLMDNLFNFELAAYAGAHTPVGIGWGRKQLLQSVFVSPRMRPNLWSTSMF